MSSSEICRTVRCRNFDRKKRELIERKLPLHAYLPIFRVLFESNSDQLVSAIAEKVLTEEEFQEIVRIINTESKTVQDYFEEAIYQKKFLIAYWMGNKLGLQPRVTTLVDYFFFYPEESIHYLRTYHSDLILGKEVREILLDDLTRRGSQIARARSQTIPE